MAIERPTAMEILGRLGLDEWAERSIAGKEDGWQAAIKNRNHLEAYMTRKVALCWGWVGDGENSPIVDDTTGSPNVRLETTFQASEGRYNVTGAALDVYVAFNKGDITIYAYEDDGTTLIDSHTTATVTSVSDEAATLDLSSYAGGDIVLKVGLEWDGVTGTGCELHGIIIQEQAVDLAQLSDYKLDTDLAADDRALSAFLTTRLVEGYSNVNTTRPNGGTIVWDNQYPLLGGGVRRYFHPLFLPLSAEAKKVRVRVWGKCRHGDVQVGVGVGTGQGTPEFGDAYDMTSTAGPEASDWMEIDVSGWQQGPLGGQLYAQVMLFFQSTKTATTTSLYSVISWDSPHFILIDSDLTGVNPEDVLNIEWWDPTKVFEDLAPTFHQVIHHNNEKRLYIFPNDNPPDSAGPSGAPIAGAKFTRWSQLEVYAIEWEEVIEAPFSSQKPVFPWSDDTRMKATVTTGQQGSAGRLRAIYGAGVHLWSTRTPAWTVLVPPRGRAKGIDWEDTNRGMWAYPTLHLEGDDTSAHLLLSCPTGVLTGITGAAATAAGVNTRTGIEILPILALLSNDPDNNAERAFRLRAKGVDEGGTVTTAYNAGDLNAEQSIIVPVTPHETYADYILTTNPGQGIVHEANNLQGLWPDSHVGQLPIYSGVPLLLNDVGADSDFVCVEVEQLVALDEGIRSVIVLMGCLVRPAQGTQLAKIGD